jgi:hypothetical protein
VTRVGVFGGVGSGGGGRRLYQNIFKFTSCCLLQSVFVVVGDFCDVPRLFIFRLEGFRIRSDVLEPLVWSSDEDEQP